MAISQWTTRLASLLAVLVMTTAAFAQNHGPAQPYYPQMHQPFIDPLAFDPDYQFFAPAEIGSFGNGWQAKTGWFGKYDRMHLYVTRPELEQNYTGVDGAWGHRVAVGYMTSDDHGWTVEGINLSGPGYYDELAIERVNRITMEDDAAGDTQEVDSVFEAMTSINVASLNGFELNKTFRLKQFHNGSYLEPILGFRYHVLNDFHRGDSYRRYDDTTGLPTPPFPNTEDEVEEIIIAKSNWENHMVGAHLGLHWFQQRPSWQLSSDLRVFASQNFQTLNQVTDTEWTLYDSVADDADIAATQTARALNWAHNEEFVWGLDVRAEAAYELTRDVSLTCGVQVLHYVQGIARGNLPDVNEEDVTMVGATFGFQVNR